MEGAERRGERFYTVKPDFIELQSDALVVIKGSKREFFLFHMIVLRDKK